MLARLWPYSRRLRVSIRHPMDTDSISNVDVIHVLRGDEDVLLAIRRVCSVDLWEVLVNTWSTHNHRSVELTIILILIRRLTASMNTSNSSVQSMCK